MIEEVHYVTESQDMFSHSSISISNPGEQIVI